MVKTFLFWLLATVVLTTAPPAQAQQPAKVPRIGYLGFGVSSTNPLRADAFRQGLRQLGYVEGKNMSLSIDLPKEN